MQHEICTQIHAYCHLLVSYNYSRILLLFVRAINCFKTGKYLEEERLNILKFHIHAYFYSCTSRGKC